MVPHIAVVGAGISGLSTAVLVQDKIPGIRITVISDKFSPDTTGDVSAGLWFPYSLKDTPPQDIVRWSSKTYDHMLKLWQSSEASDVGVSLVPKFGLTEQPEGKHQDPEWSKIPVAYQYINKSQAQKVAACHKYTGGQHFITFTLEPSRYLPYLTRKFLQNGGEIKNKKVKTLQELCGDYDVVINCTGVHAHHVAGDNLINPIRGQVLRVKAPWVFTSLGEEKVDGNYIIPNIDCVVLGGTHQQGDWNTNPDPKDTKFITEGCQQIIPGLKDAEILSDRAGLRPGRTSVRLERDNIKDKYGNTLEVIHNYGHGGAGVTLSWGCAHDVLRILQDILNNQPFTRKFTSKL